MVIDSIKNVFEANYLRARYDSFFLVALTLDDQQRFRRLKLGKKMLREHIDFIDDFLATTTNGFSKLGMATAD